MENLVSGSLSSIIRKIASDVVSRDKNAIVLAIFSLLLLLTAFLTYHMFTGLMGLLFVIVTCNKWGLWGGILASLWAAFVILTIVFLQDGSVIHAVITVSIYFIISLVSGRYIDIANKRLVALQEVEKRYRQIVHNISDVVWIADVNLNITFITPSIEKMVGETVSSHLKRPLEEKFTPDSLNKIFEVYLEVLENEKSQKNNEDESRLIEVEHYRTDGTTIWVSMHISILRDKYGNIDGFLGVSRDVTEQKLAEQEIRFLSFHDVVTGLYNRRYLEEEMQRLDTERQLPISVIMIDLDGLKLINDTYGHDTGDKMLLKAAQILKESCRKEDIIGRWGGDEFVILLTKTPCLEAIHICTRINNNFNGIYVEDMPLSLSLGVGTKDSSEQNLAEILREAEDEMYRQKLAKTRSIRSSVLNALLKTLEAKSFETEEHSRRMEEEALNIGKKLGLPHSELHRLKLLITLHDIGKINIPEEILTKEEDLTSDEWELMKKHPEMGYRIAHATEEFAHVATDILAHHERWDGSGYPQGLKRKEIPLLARITSIVDAYEVMTNGRPYRKPLTHDEVMAELKRCSGTQFDPELIEVFMEVLKEISSDYYY